MLPPRKVIMPGRTNGLSVSTANHASNFGALTFIHVESIQPCLLRTRSNLLSRCHFSCNGKRQWSLCKEPKIYKRSEARYYPSTSQAFKSFHPKPSSYTGHLINRYLSGHGWRLSSSRGSANKPPKDKSKGDEEKHYDWYTDQLKRIEQSMDHFEEIKRRIDSDPFGVLFGRRLEELYPWKWRSSINPKTAKAEAKTPKANSVNQACPAERRENLNNASKNQTDIEYCHSSTNARIPSAFGAWSESRKPTDEGYDIDPITMRKVPKEALCSDLAGLGARENRDESINILVKRFVPATSTVHGRGSTEPLKGNSSQLPSSDKPISSQVNAIPNSQADHHTRDWLAQGGFGAKGQAASMPAVDPKTELQTGKNIETESSPSKIESALERHLRRHESYFERKPTSRSNLEYDARENKTEDVDLLRPSDVRAASGLRGRNPKETAEEQQERRNSLTADYENRVQSLERQFVEEIAAHNAKGSNVNDANDKPKMPIQSFKDLLKALRFKNPNTLDNMLEDVTNAEHASRKAFTEVRNTQDEKSQNTTTAKGLEVQPAVAQWPEPGEGDMASNVHEFAGRDRWYKRRAPHAIEQSEARTMQAAKDRALFCEIRGIYEDTYGVIDTKHRQQSRTLPAENRVERNAQHTVGYEKQPSFEDGITSEEHETLSKRNKTETPENCDPPNLEGMAMIQRLFEELHETQSLFQAHKIQLEGIPTKGESSNLLQSLKESEQRVLHTLKTAWALLNTSAALPKQHMDGSSNRDTATNASKTAEGNSQSPPMAQQGPSNVYRILAYDPYTQKVTTAKTTSLKGSPNEKPLTLSEALSNLTNPAKFVPYFASLNKLGYEIISGGANILVFKNIRSQNASAMAVDDSHAFSEATTRHANPIDGTTTQTGNFASPTGFVNHDAVLPPSAPEFEQQEVPYSKQVQSGEKVRREEPVFSGSARTRWQDDYDHGPKSKAKLKSRLRRAARRKRTWRRMVWVGVWTATCCYAVGLATEHFRVQRSKATFLRMASLGVGSESS